MGLPGEKDLLAERAELLETLDGLTDEEFASGPTLCDEWAPRDVLAHLMGVDQRGDAYLRSFWNIGKANGRIVADARSQSRERLMHRARHWATHPAPHVRLAAFALMGDIATHHQDIVRGLGKTRQVPKSSAEAILREGIVLGGKRLFSHTVDPTDGGRSFGRGPKVRGTTEALGLWLSGRKGLEPELEFESA